MYVLGIESATPVAAVAVAGREGILAESMVANKRTHSVNLLPMIKAVLESVNLEHRQLNGIAVSSGPGSFTGLRIGLSTAKTLAQVWQLPLAGVSTLQALAHSFAGHNRLVCPIMNARKNEVYLAVYDYSGPVPVPLLQPRAARLEEVLEIVNNYQKPVTFLGDGVPVYKDRLTEALPQTAAFASLSTAYPRGAAVAELGLYALQNGAASDPLVLQPEYIRLSEAEVLWRKKHFPAED